LRLPDAPNQRRGDHNFPLPGPQCFFISISQGLFNKYTPNFCIRSLHVCFIQSMDQLYHTPPKHISFCFTLNYQHSFLVFDMTLFEPSCLIFEGKLPKGCYMLPKLLHQRISTVKPEDVARCETGLAITGRSAPSSPFFLRISWGLISLLNIIGVAPPKKPRGLHTVNLIYKPLCCGCRQTSQ